MLFKILIQIHKQSEAIFQFRGQNLKREKYLEKQKKNIYLRMGNFMDRMIMLGQYCDCLENWKKYDTSSETQTQNNLFMSENHSQMEIELEKAFQVQKIELGFQKQLQELHERLKKRKKLKAEYMKQKQQQRLQKQEQQIAKQQQRIKKLQRQKQLLQKQEQLRLHKQKQFQRIKRQKQENKIKANKRNKRIRDLQKLKKDELLIKLNNKSLSTADQNGLSHGQEKEKVFFRQKEGQVQQNIFDPVKQPSIQEEEDVTISFEESKKPEQSQLDIVDFDKLNPHSLQTQVVTLALKKLEIRQKQNLVSQTMPLQSKIHSHRQRSTKPKYDHHRDKLKMNGSNEGEFEAQIPAFVFGDGRFQSTIIQDEGGNYFLDDEDKEEYLKQMFK